MSNLFDVLGENPERDDLLTDAVSEFMKCKNDPTSLDFVKENRMSCALCLLYSC